MKEKTKRLLEEQRKRDHAEELFAVVAAFRAYHRLSLESPDTLDEILSRADDVIEAVFFPKGPVDPTAFRELRGMFQDEPTDA